MKMRTALMLCGLLAACTYVHAFAMEERPPPTALPGSASTPENQNLADPFEPMNRSILCVNRVIDGLFLKPIAVAYRGVMPAPARAGVSNVLQNLATPLVSLNMAFQGEGKKAGQQLGRFLINTTVGIGGLFDVAKQVGLPREDTDFDHTMAKAGVPSGPYLVLPILGPSTPRALAGRVAQVVADPFNRLMIHEGHRSYMYLRAGVQLISTRDQSGGLIEVLESDTYMYETMRSVYSQVVRAKEGKQPSAAYQAPKPSDDWDAVTHKKESQANEKNTTGLHP